MEKPYLVNQPFNILPAVIAGVQTYSQPSIADVLIFKTNIQTQGDKFYLKLFLDKHPLIANWNIDLEDIDCVLRVVSTHLQHSHIIELLASRGYYCEELA